VWEVHFTHNELGKIKISVRTFSFALSIQGILYPRNGHDGSVHATSSQIGAECAPS